MAFHRGVKTLKFVSELDNTENIPVERIRRYSLFKKIVCKGDTVVFVNPSNEDDPESEISVKTETF